MIVTGKGITNQFGNRREKCGMVWSVWLDEFAQLHLGKGICYETVPVLSLKGRSRARARAWARDDTCNRKR